MFSGRSFKEWMGIAAFVAISLLALRFFYSPEAPEVSGSTSGSRVALIESGALSNYTRSGYPRTYATWGDEGVERIKERELAAANHVARSGQCDRVSYVGLSEKESSPPSEIVVYVDCANGNRFYVGSYELTREPQFLVVRKRIN